MLRLCWEGFSLWWLLLLCSKALGCTGFSSCSSQGLELRLSSYSVWAQLLCSMWDLPGSGIKPTSPARAGKFFTTEPPGKPPQCGFKEQLFFAQRAKHMEQPKALHWGSLKSQNACNGTLCRYRKERGCALCLIWKDPALGKDAECGTVCLTCHHLCFRKVAGWNIYSYQLEYAFLKFSQTYTCK